MSGEREPEPPPAVGGWAVVETRKAYGVAYGLEWLVGLVVAPVVPPRPDNIYTLQNLATGERRRVRLPADSPADALDMVAAVWDAPKRG